MKILREYLGGQEVIDLGTEDGYKAFAEGIVQDYEAADEAIERLRAEGEVVVNDNEPEYIERWTVIGEGS